MSGWRWWRSLDWHESALWIAALAFAQDAPHFYSPLVQGVAIGLLAAALLVALRRRFALVALVSAFGLWRAAGMTPAPAVPAWRLWSVVFPAAFAVMLAIGAGYRWRGRREAPTAQRS